MNETTQDDAVHRTTPLIVFLFLVTASIVLSTGRYVTENQTNGIPSDVPQVLITVFMLSAIVVSLAFVSFGRQTSDPKTTTTWRDIIRRHLVLFGIVPFYFLGVVIDFGRLLVEAMCADAWVIGCSNAAFARSHRIDAVYHLTRIVFMGTEMIACVRLHALNLHRTRLVVYGIAFLQSANIAVWLDSLLSESDFAERASNATDDELALCVAVLRPNGSGLAGHVERCLRGETREYRLMQSASPYLYPFAIEFLMLATESVAHWFFDLSPSTPAANARSGGSANAAAAEEEEEDGTSHPGASASHLDVDGDDEDADSRQSTPYPESLRDYGSLRSSSPRRRSTSTPGEDDETVPLLMQPPVATSPSPTNASGCKFPCFYILVTLGGLANVLFILFGALTLSDHTQEDMKAYRDIFYEYRIGYWAVIIATTLGAWWLTKDSKKQTATMPSGFELLVILSCVGPAAQCMFSMMANVKTPPEVSQTNLYLIEEILNIFEVFVQTVFYFRAKRIRLDREKPDPASIRHHKARVLVFRLSVLLLTVCNGVMWLEDSLVETRNLKHSFQHAYLANWPYIYNLTNPILLIYRFNSMMLFMHVYLHQRH